ncbi:MAG: UvrB/UvrC motif-containing protein [Planctomycetes bacterium]|nr:UvrB/UvrC motif-containing protein [Planctomycetota bacterium]
MICEVCREALATVHLTEIVNNSKKEIHLCESCAQQKGVAIHAQVKNLSIPEFFGHLVETRSPETAGGKEPQCPECGMTYRQFRSGGKLGCPHDYTIFRQELEQLLEKIHGSTQHKGKVPKRMGNLLGRDQEIADARAALQAAVKNEEYEKAAALRDRIYELERKE